ncbi:hypothetical protein [Criblamydia sequanensis]|uniref:Uncharacterized protein n=1 Tax=Candidatus Criblamydia sequanensis CRIB-18 TaxID=1437425 RepID=A0A090D0G2_9BACT|nr:hypothetical protein [Criblamydia sequanensis]CDR34766.1 hypothetical protein CSEC_1959 [Criblamydia sequanensis CRIB-18]
MYLLSSLSATTELSRKEQVLMLQFEQKRDCAHHLLQHLSIIPVFTYTHQLAFQEIIRTKNYSDLNSLRKTKNFAFHLRQDNLEKTVQIARRCQELFLKLKTEPLTSEEFIGELFKEEFEEADRLNKAKNNRYQAALFIDYLTSNQDLVPSEDAKSRMKALIASLGKDLGTIFAKLLSPAYMFKQLEPISKKEFLFGARPDFTIKNKLLFTLSVKEELLEGEAVYEGELLFDELGCVQLTELAMKTSPFLSTKDLQKKLIEVLAAIFASKIPECSFLVFPKSILGEELLSLCYESGFPEASPYEKTISIPLSRAKEFFETSSLGQKIYNNLFTVPNSLKI